MSKQCLQKHLQLLCGLRYVVGMVPHQTSRKRTSSPLAGEKRGVAFRLSPAQMEALADRAQRDGRGLSPDLYAKETLLEHLGEAPKMRSLQSLAEELRELRSEMALATEVLLVSAHGGMTPLSPEEVKAWVRSNFKSSGRR